VDPRVRKAGLLTPDLTFLSSPPAEVHRLTSAGHGFEDPPISGSFKIWFTEGHSLAVYSKDTIQPEDEGKEPVKKKKHSVLEAARNLRVGRQGWCG
jgi:hypothetical protein